MDKLFELIPPQVFTTVGVLVLIFVILFKDRIADSIFKRKHPERYEDDGEEFVERRTNHIDVERLFSIMEKNVEATTRFAEEMKILNEEMRDKYRRTAKEHEEILEEVVRLDVSRKHR